MKIAMLGHKCVPSREGGIEVAVEELCSRMAEQGHRVICYNRSGHYAGGQEEKGDQSSCYKGIELKTVFTVHRRGLAAVTSSVFAAWRAAFGGYDVVHFHAEGACAMMWLPKLLGRRCIATIHGLDWKRAKWGNFAAGYIKLGEKTAVRYADAIVVLSRNMQDYFLREYGRKTVFIPNGVNRPVPAEARLIREKWGLEKDRYILFLGRLVPEKGIECLIHAFKQVRTEKRLVISGGSSDTDRFIEKMKKISGSDPRILFTGFVQGQILDELYSNAYLYTLPSEVEGMPLSLMEAMSYGNCCLTSDIAECTEVVEDRAVVFQKGDAEDLREKLQRLCDHPDEVARYKKEAADFICQKYQWDDAAERTLALYRQGREGSFS